jgi:hypothetical protein
MCKIWQVIAVAVVGLGLSFVVVGCGSSTNSAKDKMSDGKMTDDKMMAGDKMGSGKMTDDKMVAGDKMGGGKMTDDKMVAGDKKGDAKMSGDKGGK